VPSARVRRRGPKPVAVPVNAAQQRKLRKDLRRRKTPQEVGIRVRIVLALARNHCVTETARALSVDLKTVRRWRDAWLSGGRKALLAVRVRPGRPPRIDVVSRCQVIGMACGKPADFGAAYRNTWTLDSLLECYRERFPDLDPMSRTSLVRILSQANIRPHKMKVWLHSPDPLFREKVTEICNLYLSAPEGSVVVCVDEKPGMQALGRKHPVKQPARGRDGRRDHEYIRNGTRKLIAAFDIHTGRVYGEVRPNRTAQDLVEFMEALAELLPGKQVHVIWDNLNIHYDGPSKRWTRFNERHGGRFHFHYTPIHASWVNQVELFFGILQRRLLRYGVHNSLEELDADVLGFIAHWNAEEAHPFNWTFKGYPLQIGSKAA